MNISVNQADNIVKATISEGQNTLNFNIDVDQERKEQQEYKELAARLDKEFADLFKDGKEPTEEEKAALIGPYFTNPSVFLNATFFVNALTNKDLKLFIAELSNKGRNEVDITPQLMEEIYGKSSEEESAPEEEIETETEEEIDNSEEEAETEEEIDLPIKHNSIKASIKVGTPEMKIRYHKEKYPDLPQVVQHGNFIDLYVAKGCHLKEGEFKLIDLGISVECPEGYWMQLVPRSSTFKKYGIIQTNSFGVIDTSYCGDNDIVMLPVYATRNTRIPKGERICQFRLVKDIPFNIVEVDKLEGPDRGGFGSTGKK
jgi:dUTP pyrophosphatase